MTALAQRLNAVWRREGKPDWLLMVILAIPLGVIALDPDQFTKIMTLAGTSLARTAVYIAIAVGLLAYLKATGAESLVAQAFQGSITRMIMLGALVGGLAPFCSCEVIPFIAGLLALGAPLPAVMAFWLSSPLMDPVQFSITVGAFGEQGFTYAIAKTVAAVALGVAGGFALRGLTAVGAFADPLRNAPAKRCGCGPSPFSGKPVWAFWREEQRVKTFRETALEQGVFLLRWLTLAYLIEALMITYIPAEMVVKAVGGEGVLPVIISAFVGMPAYLNGVAAPPLVATLVEQGMQPAAALTFMVAGAVSSIPAMMAVYTLVKRPVFVAYMIFGVGGAILAGLTFGAVIS
ncbi:MAG: permease [Neomegalonema sp.]|nr:permease [Neomegalonema sp.]